MPKTRTPAHSMTDREALEMFERLNGRFDSYVPDALAWWRMDMGNKEPFYHETISIGQLTEIVGAYQDMRRGITFTASANRSH